MTTHTHQRRLLNSYRLATHERLHFAEQRRGEAKTCMHEQCGRNTREGKPYCYEHVNYMPFVQELEDALEQRSVELDRVAKHGERAVDPEGPIARDILTQLRIHGPATLRRLSRTTGIAFDSLVAYVSGLIKHGMVEEIALKRKDTRAVRVRESS